MSADRTPFDAHINYQLAAIAVAFGVAGIIVAWVFYRKENQLPQKVSEMFGKAYTWAYHKFYIDEVYQFVVKQILFKRVAGPAAKFDRKVVDGTMVGIGNSTVKTSENIKGMQSGKLQDYAMAFVAGILLIAIVFIYYWKG